MQFDGQQNDTSSKHSPPDSSLAENLTSPHLDSGTNSNFSTTQVPDEIDTAPRNFLRPFQESNFNSTVRSRNFSFASTYRPNINTFNNRVDSSQTLDILTPYKPITAFTILKSEEGFSGLGSSKPNAIVRPIRRFDNHELAWPVCQDLTNGRNTLWPQQREHHLKDNLNSIASKKMTNFSLVRPNIESTEQLRAKLNRKLHNLQDTAQDPWLRSRHFSNVGH